jgi:hypothetical protein
MTSLRMGNSTDETLDAISGFLPIVPAVSSRVPVRKLLGKMKDPTG